MPQDQITPLPGILRMRDFKTFGKPFIYIERPKSVIDANIVKDGPKYYRFTKDESNKVITMETSDQLMGTWTDVQGFALSKKQGYEGPECYQLSSGTWCLIADHYATSTGYEPFVSRDIASGLFEAVPSFKFPFVFRHGSVLSISDEEYSKLESASVRGFASGAANNNK